MSTPSPLRSFARLVVERLRDPPEGSSVALPQGVEVAADGLRITPRQLARYLRATAGESLSAGRAVRPLPPVLPCIWENALLLDLLRVGKLPVPLRGIVHLGGERIQLRSATTADTFRLVMRLERITSSRRGTQLRLASRLTSRSGQLVSMATTEMLLRVPVGASERAGRAGRRAAERAEGEGEGWREIEQWRVPAHAGRRYARASGDFNPIHLSRATARPFGFRSAILHGFCLEAMVAHAFIERLWEGNVDALRRTAIRFVSPLFIPAAVALEVKETADAAGWGGEFRVREAAGAGRILAVGSYLGGRPATQG